MSPILTNTSVVISAYGIPCIYFARLPCCCFTFLIEFSDRLLIFCWKSIKTRFYNSVLRGAGGVSTPEIRTARRLALMIRGGGVMDKDGAAFDGISLQVSQKSHIWLIFLWGRGEVLNWISILFRVHLIAISPLVYIVFHGTQFLQRVLRVFQV
jgi:hypothetical protein